MFIRPIPRQVSGIVAGVVVALGAAVHLAGDAGAALPAQKDGDPVTIGTWRTMRSEVLGEERRLLVRLPDGYERSTERYPLLITLSGQQVTRYFAEAVMAADNLTATLDGPDLIVVGISDADPRRDYLPVLPDGTTPSGADSFLRFVADELVPFLDKAYRTKPFRVLVAPPAGAALALHALTSRPGLFQASVVRLGYPFPGEAAFRQYFLEKAAAFVAGTPELTAFVHVNVDAGSQAPTLEFANQLAAIVEGKTPRGLRFSLRVDEPSADIQPLIGTAPALRTLFAGYKLRADPPPDTVEAIEAHARAYSERLGAAIDPPSASLVVAVDWLLKERQFEKALPMVEHAARLYPASADVIWRLGETRRRLGRWVEARDAYLRFLELRADETGAVRQRIEEMEQAIEAIKKK